jgi:hypothetical protein
MSEESRQDEALNDFERRLRQRLKSRWQCEAPLGYRRGEIERDAGIELSNLPAVYVRFLETCGREAGGLFCEYHWSLNSRVARNEELRLVCEEFDLPPPAHVFSFLDDLGDYYWCFAPSSDPNPPVLRYDTGVAWITLPLRLDEFLLTWEQFE